MTLRLTTLFSLPTSIGLGLVAEPLISLLFGADWIEGALPLQLMCAFSTAFALTLNVRQILNVAGRPLLGLWLAGINAILSLVALTLAAPLGLAAAALSGGLAYTLCLPVAILFLNRTLGTDTRRLVRDQLPIWLATAIMAIVVIGLGTGRVSGKHRRPPTRDDWHEGDSRRCDLHGEPSSDGALPVLPGRLSRRRKRQDYWGQIVGVSNCSEDFNAISHRQGHAE